MDKRSKIKAGLSFGIAMTIFFIMEGLPAHDTPTVKNIITFIISVLFRGAVAGLLFGWLMGWFANSKFVAQATKIDVEKDEKILFETGANHVKGTEGVGGKLYLTNKRLVFKSHKINIQNHELSIGLAGIEKVERYKTLELVNNGLSVTTTGNKPEKFVVQQIDKWISKLAEERATKVTQ